MTLRDLIIQIATRLVAIPEWRHLAGRHKVAANLKKEALSQPFLEFKLVFAVPRIGVESSSLLVAAFDAKAD
jgi:hypothetical protein